MKANTILLAAFSLAAPAFAVEINYSSPAFEIGATSTGSAFATSFTFAIGSFDSFTPDAANTELWVTHFETLGVAAWDTDFSQFSNTVTLALNSGPFSTATQAYIWGYDSITGATNEWVLFTNSSWLFPLSANLIPTTWDVSDAGTVAVVGSISMLGSDPYIKSAAVSAIPEPSTYAALFGALALLVGIRFRGKRRASH